MPDVVIEMSHDDHDRDSNGQDIGQFSDERLKGTGLNPKDSAQGIREFKEARHHKKGCHNKNAVCDPEIEASGKRQSFHDQPQTNQKSEASEKFKKGLNEGLIWLGLEN